MRREKLLILTPDDLIYKDDIIDIANIKDHRRVRFADVAMFVPTDGSNCEIIKNRYSNTGEVIKK